MQLTTCLLTFLFLLSVKGAQVAKARVRFAQTTYTVMESSTICMEVINDSPIPTRFSVDFTFSGVLLGIEGAASTRSSTIFFEAMQRSSMACIATRTDDSTPCEADIRGTVTLKNNSVVSTINPVTATVIIRDNDAITATFGKSMYTVKEGDGAISLFPFVNSSLSGVAQLTIIGGTNYEMMKLRRSIFIVDSVLNSPGVSVPLSGIINDDDIALEDAEHVALALAVNAQQHCMLRLSPYNETTILVTDDDEVNVKITRPRVTAREGEDYRLCVSTSKMIARDLVLYMKITTETADLVDIEQTSNMFEMILHAYDYDMTECTDIPIVQDNIVEDDEQFSVQIMSSNSVPASVQGNLHINKDPAIITILDTSTCIEHLVGSDVADMSDVYVVGDRTLCFTCQSCQSPDISWKVTSFEGNVWTGLTGGRLHSRHNLTDQGVVYENGTLLITNSSTLFSKSRVGTVTFTQMDAFSLSKTFRIILGDGATIISLNLYVEGNASKIVCLFRGNPQPTVQWIIGNSTVGVQDRIETVAKDDHFISTLTLKDVTNTQYECRVKNLFGEHSLQGFIHIPTTYSSSSKLIVSYVIYVLSALLFLCL